MIYKIARKEFVELLRDGRFRLTGLIVFALLIASFLVGWDYYRKTSRERAAIQESNYEQWLNQGKRNAHSATHYGIYVFKPLLPLAFADKGLDDYTGTAIFLESHKQNEAKLRPVKDAATIARFGELTAAAVLQFFVPPLAMQSALNDLAATGFFRYHGFLDQVHEFHTEWKNFFLPKLFKNERLAPADYNRMPKFAFAEEPFSDVLMRVGSGLAAILIPTFLIGFLTRRKLKNFSVAG